MEIQDDPAPQRNVFTRSDQYNFIRHGIPSLMPAFGMTKGSPEAAMITAWNRDRYHAPSDDLNKAAYYEHMATQGQDPSTAAGYRQKAAELRRQLTEQSH